MNYFKIAWRNIRKHPGFSLINAGGLSLGIASFLLLMMYVSYHLNFDHQFKNLDNIYLVENNQPGDGKIYTFAAAPRLLASTIKSQVPGVVQTTRVVNYGGSGLLTYNNNSFKKAGLFADPAFFSMFSYHFLEGDPAKALSQPNSVVLTKTLAQTLFGDKEALGKVVTRNNSIPLIVTGVIEDVPPTASYQFECAMPWVVFETENGFAKNADWGTNFNQTFVQLKDQASFAKANALIKPMIAKYNTGNKSRLMLFPLAKFHTYGKFENGEAVGGLIDQLHQFEILGLCILLVACVNFMNLSTARSEERAKEVGIRKAIGSGRSSLIWQFITESLIISLFSTLVAVGILAFSIPYFNTLLNINMTLPVGDWQAWAVVVGIGVVTGLISGSYPAFYLSSFEPIKVLKGMFKGGSSALPVRKIMVVVQFAFAVFLITATICIYRQIQFVQQLPNGYDKNNLVEIPVEGALNNKADVFINDLKSNGAITNATQVSLSITQTGNNTSGMSWPGKRPDEHVLVDILLSGYNFAETTGIKIITGREFSTQFPVDTTTHTAMINETAAKLMNLKHPEGTQIKWGDQPLTVIGVFKDFVRGSPYDKVPPMVVMYGAQYASNIDLRLNPAKSITASISLINKELKTLNPAFPPTIQFVDKDFEAKFESERTLGILANIFGGLAIVISCLGLFALAAHAAEQRTKEIGVRKVLGATVANITGLLSKDFMILVGFAIILAVPAYYWAMGKWLNNYSNHIDLSWWMVGLAGLVTIVIALATVSYQAIKAALANPVKSLRSE